jgi:predicted phosphoribosyltransferase
MDFPSREAAGRQLGLWLRQNGVQADVVLGLPRGGVVVAAQVAQVMGNPLDVLVVRKIGHPHFPEFAVGALAEPDVVLWDNKSLETNRVALPLLDEVVEREKLRLKELQGLFHRSGPPDLAGLSVLLVDDGLATGATAEAAVLACRKQGASKVMVATPVASTTAVRRLENVADEVRALLIDPGFAAVGQYYQEFSQTSDAEVIELLTSRR